MRIEAVEPASPADTGGLLAGDLLLDLDAAPIASVDQLHRMLTHELIDRSVTAVFSAPGRRLRLVARKSR